MSDEDDIDDFRAARRALGLIQEGRVERRLEARKGGATRRRLDGSPEARKARSAALSASVDRRKLRGKGERVQVNIRMPKTLKARVDKAAGKWPSVNAYIVALLERETGGGDD